MTLSIADVREREFALVWTTCRSISQAENAGSIPVTRSLANVLVRALRLRKRFSRGAYIQHRSNTLSHQPLGLGTPGCAFMVSRRPP
jgi:hypothetical protein